MLKTSLILSASFAMAITASAALGQEATNEKYTTGTYPLTPIHFPAGKSSTTINDSVERASSATYSFGAKARQKAEIKLKSVENNAVFTIYLPGATTKNVEGSIDVQGPVLPGIDTNTGTTKWSGTLPKDGDYIITINGTRGNVEYELQVSIK